MALFCLPNGPQADEAFITEGAGMNMFFLVKLDDGSIQLITPPLNGTILPGITRMSVLELSKE